jgi:CBS domain-containing protein
VTLTARDVMRSDVVTIDAGRPLGDLEEVLLRHRIQGAPVTEAGKLVGIVSRSDVVRQLKLEEEKIAASAFYFEAFDADEHRAEDYARVMEATASRVAKLCVRDLMIRDLVTVTPDAPLQQVAAVMFERRIHRVLVTEGDELRGIVSSLDLVELFARGRAQA